jgi:hypothetical protein
MGGALSREGDGVHVFGRIVCPRFLYDGDEDNTKQTGNFGTRVDNSVFTTRLGTNTFLTGSYGPEDSVLGTLVLLLVLLALRFFVKKPDHPAWTFESGLPLTRGNN